MASFINLDRTEGQVESPESSARQFSRYLVIKETKGNETEKNWLPLLPNKISNNITDVLEKGELHLHGLILFCNQYSCTISTFLSNTVTADRGVQIAY